MRRGSFIALIIGLAIGVGIGLYYAWSISPVIVTNTKPWQLGRQSQINWMVAASLAYAHNHDLQRAASRLLELQLGDKTWQALADAACELTRTSFISTNTGQTAVRSMIEIARSQGATSCAANFFLNTNTPEPTATIPTATPTIIRPATKTPTPTLGPTFTPPTQEPLESPTPAGAYRLALVEPVCNPKAPGVLEITVQDTNGAGIPGVQVEVDNGESKDDFYTGLKPEIGAGYADFQMTAGSSYVVSLPNLSDKTRALDARQCTAAPSDGGGKVPINGYRVIFRRAASG